MPRGRPLLGRLRPFATSDFRPRIAIQPYPLVDAAAAHTQSSVGRVLTVVGYVEGCPAAFESPDLAACPLWVLAEVLVAVEEIAINGRRRRLGRSVVAAVNDGTRHSAE